jgi:hypothetical protein
MEPNQYLGRLSLALVPGLGARMAGKLLREFAAPEAIFKCLAHRAGGAKPPGAGGPSHPHAPSSERCGARTCAGGTIPLPTDQLVGALLPAPAAADLRSAAAALREGQCRAPGPPFDRHGGSASPHALRNQMAGRLGRDLAERGLVVVKRPCARNRLLRPIKGP